MHQNTYQSITAAVMTISDTRNQATDKGGATVINHLSAHDITVSHYEIVQDDINAIQQSMTQLINSVDIIITTGGTGIAKRDVTIEAVKPLVGKEMEGFGELFRYLSFTEDVGTKAMLSRAFCGTSGHTVIFCIPGSVGAVDLAMKKLITQEVFHMVNELHK